MDKVETIRRYRELYEELNEIVLAWDPYALYRQGELRDEFSDEVTRLLAVLPATRSEDDVVAVVSKVFSESFSTRDFSNSTCRPVGATIFKWWRTRR